MGEDPATGRSGGAADTSRLASRWTATLLLSLAGLGLAWAHWLGLVAGATLVALPQRTLARGVVAGIAFGVLAVLANALVIASGGNAALETYLTMGEVLAVSVVIPLVAGLVGGLFGGLAGGIGG